MARGIDGRALFEDDLDRTFFLSQLERMMFSSGYRCYAWVLMGNHYHLLPRISSVPLGKSMGWLNSTYARYHAKRHGRRGYLFQDRFKSIVTQDQGYVERLIRYVHLNPIRAGICRSLEELGRYPWCGHGAIMGAFASPFLDVDRVLRRFGTTIGEARRRYESFLAEGLGDGDDDEELLARMRDANVERRNRHEPGCWVIGDADFVRNALAEDKERRLRAPAHAVNGWTLERLAHAVEHALELETGELRKRGHANLRARSRKIFCYYAVRRLEFTGSQTALWLGVTAAAVSRSLDSGERLAKYCDLRLVE